MKNPKSFIIIITLLVLSSCSVGPRPVEYGKDHCALCEMTIMDPRYGTEIVTGKGKVYTFDSIECLVDYLKNDLPESEKPEFILVTPFEQPGELADARTSWYLHSRALPSPMGMFLTAFGSEQEARAAKKNHHGLLFSWEELLGEFEHLNPSLLK